MLAPALQVVCILPRTITHLYPTLAPARRYPPAPVTDCSAPVDRFGTAICPVPGETAALPHCGIDDGSDGFDASLLIARVPAPDHATHFAGGRVVIQAIGAAVSSPPAKFVAVRPGHSAIIKSMPKAPLHGRRFNKSQSPFGSVIKAEILGGQSPPSDERDICTIRPPPADAERVTRPE